MSMTVNLTNDMCNYAGLGYILMGQRLTKPNVPLKRNLPLRAVETSGQRGVPAKESERA